MVVLRQPVLQRVDGHDDQHGPAVSVPEEQVGEGHHLGERQRLC